jgi:molybdopterin/thiamine biosynthesis adenylyltransferase/rhodanese-related sulfurtransferase
MRPLVDVGRQLSAEERERASRNIALPGFGETAQRRLANSRVLVLGAGGLGSPVLHYLAAAGVGTIGIVDFDTVDLSNLQRQVIHRTADVGELKTTSAARAISALDPGIRVVEHPVTLTRHNALDTMGDYDLIIDGTDNFATRYLANDAAAILRLPYVWGSVLRYDGQVTVFWEGAPEGRSLDYRDLHPVPPAPGDVLSCAEAGVLGSVCATIGAMMATEAIKLISGVGDPLLGRVQNLDAQAASFTEFELRRHPARIPVTELIDYDAFCGVPQVDTRYECEDRLPNAPLVDVREPYEHERGHLDGDVLIPLGQLLADPNVLGPGPVVIYCATGIRSARAVEALRASGIESYSLRGGLAAR